MNKKKTRDTPEIVIPKGYEPEEFLDTDDEGYADENPILSEEVNISFERD